MEFEGAKFYFSFQCKRKNIIFSGLEDQLLGRVVAEERPDLEEAKNQLIVTNAKMKQELKVIEDQILYRLSASEGNPVDNVELIEVLEQSKVKAGEIQVINWLQNCFSGVVLKLF